MAREGGGGGQGDVGETKITRSYLGVRAALALCLILLGAVGAHLVTLAGQRAVAARAPIADALDEAHLGVAQLTLDMSALSGAPGGQRAESLRGSVRRSARMLDSAKATLADAAAADGFGPETARIVADPSLDPLGLVAELLDLAAVLAEPFAPSGDAALRHADVGVALAKRLMPLLKRMKETESAALDAAIADLGLYSRVALALTVATVLATALFIHRPMARRILYAQREASARRAAAEAASEAKSQFLATMSHEIRTPMNGVLGMADLLRATRLDDEQRRMLDIVSRSGEALMALIDSVLDLSKIEAGRYRLTAAPFDLAETCADVVALFSGRASGKGVTLSFEQSPRAGPVPAIGDAGALRQALSNLVGNAVKFTPKGSVVVRLRDDGLDGEGRRRVVLSVADTGVGIAPEAQARVFEQFEQADQSTTREFGGTGLGLAIVRKLIEAMGGVVELSSAVGAGSTFTLRLALPAAVGPATEAASPASPVGGAEPLRALVAEDNSINQMVIAAMLQREGCAVSFAANGLALLALFREHPCDVVFMDLSMPVMGGCDAARAIREHERRHGLPRTRVYGLSAHALPAYRDAALAAGMDGFVTKPLTAEALRAVLADVRGVAVSLQSA